MMSSAARGHADAQGVTIKFANSFAQAIQELNDNSYDLCLVDLQSGGMDMEALAEKVGESGVSTIVYAQHVYTEIIEKARSLEFAEVMSRGQFNKCLSDIVGRLKA